MIICTPNEADRHQESWKWSSPANPDKTWCECMTDEFYIQLCYILVGLLKLIYIDFEISKCTIPRTCCHKWKCVEAKNSCWPNEKNVWCWSCNYCMWHRSNTDCLYAGNNTSKGNHLHLYCSPATRINISRILIWLFYIVILYTYLAYIFVQTCTVLCKVVYTCWASRSYCTNPRPLSWVWNMCMNAT